MPKIPSKIRSEIYEKLAFQRDSADENAYAIASELKPDAPVPEAAIPRNKKSVLSYKTGYWSGRSKGLEDAINILSKY